MQAGAPAAVAEPQDVGELPAGQGYPRLAPGEKLANGLVGLGCGGDAGKHGEVVAGETQVGTHRAQDQADGEGGGEIGVQPGRQAEVFISVADPGPPRRQQVQRRDRRIARAQVGEAEGVMKTAARTAQVRGLVEGVERSAFHGAGETRGPLALRRCDGDHAADGVRAIEAALGAAQDLDAGDAGDCHLAEVEGAADARIIGVDAVDDDLGVVSVGPADEHRGKAAGPPGLDDVQPRRALQGVGQGAPLSFFDVGRGDQGDRTGDLVDGRRRARRGDHHGGIVRRRRGEVLAGCRSSQGGEGRHGGEHGGGERPGGHRRLLARTAPRGGQRLAGRGAPAGPYEHQ